MAKKRHVVQAERVHAAAHERRDQRRRGLDRRRVGRTDPPRRRLEHAPLLVADRAALHAAAGLCHVPPRRHFERHIAHGARPRSGLVDCGRQLPGCARRSPHWQQAHGGLGRALWGGHALPGGGPASGHCRAFGRRRGGALIGGGGGAVVSAAGARVRRRLRRTRPLAGALLVGYRLGSSFRPPCSHPVLLLRHAEGAGARAPSARLAQGGQHCAVRLHALDSLVAEGTTWGRAMGGAEAQGRAIGCPLEPLLHGLYSTRGRGLRSGTAEPAWGLSRHTAT